jgi:hypothetical protein
VKKGNLNLYIDESGSGAIYEKSKNYRFFLMTGIIFDENKEPKASSFFHEWKTKYLVNAKYSLHASDIYENHIDKKTNKNKKYRKKILNDIKEFAKAIDKLVDFLVNLKLSARICYIDLFEVRKALHLNPYIIGKKQSSFKEIISLEYNKEILYPVTVIANRLYQQHEKLINKNSYYKSGFIFYESQSEYDLKLLTSFHKYVKKSYEKENSYSFGDLILGISFLNKSSLCAGLDIADYVSYCYTQILRERFCKNELIITPDKFKIMKNQYHYFMYNSDIKKFDVTEDCIRGLKEIRKLNYNKKAS